MFEEFALLPSNVIRLCGWEGATNGQLRDITFQYLYSHPAERHLLANYLIARAMKEAFPCK